MVETYDKYTLSPCSKLSECFLTFMLLWLLQGSFPPSSRQGQETEGRGPRRKSREEVFVVCPCDSLDFLDVYCDVPPSFYLFIFVF